MVTPVTVSPKATIRRGGVRKSKRSSIRSISPNLVYDFALRCAIRAHLEQTETKLENTSNGSDVSPSGSLSKKKEEHHLSFQSSFSSFTDKFTDEKTDKLTREFVKGLTQRLQDVYKEKDTSKTEYNDPRFRAVARIVKKSLQEHKFRPSGTINDTVMILFLKTSEAELKSSQQSHTLWYEDINPFMARFAEMVIQTIQEDAPSCGTPELMEKLNGFCAPQTEKRSSQTEKRSSDSSNHSTNSTLSSLLEFPMVMTIQNLFKVDDKEHRQKLAELVPFCTESALLHDFKKCINNVHTNQAFPGRKEDFPTPQAYDHWQKKELKQLTELMKSLMLMNPNLSIASSSEVDVGNTNLLARQNSIDSYSSVSSQNSNNSMNDSSAFTFIPSDTRNCFRFLMKLCLDHDTKDLESIPEAERAKTSALSQQSDQLLRECWRTWRLSSPFRAILYLSLVKSKFDENELGLEDLQDALRALDRVTKENELSSWSTADRGSVSRALDGVQSSLMSELAKGLSEYSKISPIWVQDIIDLLEKLYSNTIFAESHPLPEDEFVHLEDVIKGAAIERWRYIEKSFNNPENDDLSNLFDMSDKLSKELGGLALKKFPEPIMGIISVPSLVMARQMPYFALEMDNWNFSPDFKTCPVDSAFSLYEKVLNLEKLYDEFGPKTKKSLFKVESWFLPHVKRWLTQTNESTLEWVENAVNQDRFQRLSDLVVHSSSVIDLFTMFNQAVDFISNLQWPNDVQFCLFQTFMAKIIGQGIEHYCRAMNDLIRKDIQASTRSSTNTQETAVDPASPSILDKARNQIMGNRSLDASCQPMNCITPELCVKLNNFEAARAKLDRLYRSMEVDDIAQFLRQNLTQQNTPKAAQNKFLYTIRVIRAENLQPMDKNGLSDPYVVFEIDGKLITRTHTVYETLNPRWDQEFDIWLSDSKVDVCVVVNDEDMLTADEECGAAWFTLSPKFNDVYQKDDLVLSLSPQGSLVLRVTMESEKNDIQFWFGKAFRTLKTSEKDTAGFIIDQIAPFLRQCLSRQVLDNILGRDKTGGFFSVFSRVTSQQTDPDLQACEDAIAPLLDFLEYNLSILNNNLSETNMKFIVLNIWEQILTTLEGVMLPPLSEQLSNMKPLDDHELRIVLKWLELLKILFNGGEDADAIPLDFLENDQYYSILAINAAYNLETQVLMDGYHYRTKGSSSSASLSINSKPANRSKTVYHSKNTIRQKKPKTQERQRSTLVDMPHADAILRILRMRNDDPVGEFLRQEFEKRNKSSSQTEDDIDNLLIKKTPSQESSSSLKHHNASTSGVILTD